MSFLSFNFRSLCGITCLSLGCAISAHAASTLQPNADGTVLDTATGLVWKRCQEGQTWDGSTCASRSNTYTFDQANALSGSVTFAGQSDWRLPTIRELQSIVNYSTANPSRDASAFPDSSRWYWYVWSSTAYAGNTSLRWAINFADGYLDSNAVRQLFHVRLVRAGSSLPAMNLARPTTDYADLGNGTVLHTPTGLVWQRCLQGQVWIGSACTGTPDFFTWDEANVLTSNATGKTDWRLPSPAEMLSLFDYTKSKPAANIDVFPNNTWWDTWSNTLNAGNSNMAWGLISSSGSLLPGERNSSLVLQPARFVRTTQSPTTAAPPTDSECFLDWAEARLPTVLTPAHQPTQTAGSIQYRAYPATGVYFGLNGTAIVALGGPVGPNVVTLGNLSDFLPAARATSCK
jgi:hypothetical protein